MNNETASDVKPAEVKVTTEKALAVFQPKVNALLKEVISGFELDAADAKSRKYIFRALCKAAGQYMHETEGLSLSKLTRNAARGVASLIPPPAYEPESDDDSSDGDEGESDE